LQREKTDSWGQGQLRVDRDQLNATVLLHTVRTDPLGSNPVQKLRANAETVGME